MRNITTNFRRIKSAVNGEETGKRIQGKENQGNKKQVTGEKTITKMNLLHAIHFGVCNLLLTFLFHSMD